jgi:hypothetical protein
MRMRMSWVLLVVLCGLMAMGLPAAAQDVGIIFEEVFDENNDALSFRSATIDFLDPEIVDVDGDSAAELETNNQIVMEFYQQRDLIDFSIEVTALLESGVLQIGGRTKNLLCQGYQVDLQPSDSMVRLYRIGSDCAYDEQLAEASAPSLVYDEWFTIRLTMIESYLAVFINDELVLEAFDSSYVRGSMHLYFEPESSASGSALMYLSTLRLLRVDEDTVATVPTPPPGEGRTSREEEPEVVLTEFDPTGTQQEIIDSLRVMGYLPEDGGSFLFGEDYAYFFGQGNWFTPLASRSPRTDVVMAGDLTFTYGDSDDLQSCGLMAHVSVDGSGTTTQLLQAGIDNAGYAYIFDAASQDDVDYYDDFIGFESGDTVHLLFIVIGGNTSLFINGEPVIDREKTDNRSGSYGISLTGRTADDGCEGRNIWVWSFDE